MVRRLSIATAWAAAAIAASQARAQQVPSEAPAVPVETILDVPYLPQSVLLCGGAALAMAERWWGRRGVYAEDFAALVRPAEGGIRTTDLAAAAGERGWDTRRVATTGAAIHTELVLGVPVIALIEVGQNRYHFVVVIHWGDDQVVFHDPARAPNTRMSQDEFLTRWTAADRWAMTIRPLAPERTTAVPAAASETKPPDPLPCPPWLARGVDAALADRLDEAAQVLATAQARCANEPRVLRELAGVRFRQARYPDAVALAEQYLIRAPEDSLGWQLLGAARYLSGNRGGALDAWNRIGRPTVDLIRLEGTRSVRFKVVADALSAPPGTVVSPARLTLAERRVADLPAIRTARVDWEPEAGGLAEIHGAVTERPVLAPPRRLLARAVLGAVGRREVGIEVATPLGAGEVWSAAWRWTEARPRLAFLAEFPVRLGLPGVLGIESAWERFRFGVDTAAARVVANVRRSAGVEFGTWVSASLRPTAALRLERWSSAGSFLAGMAGAQWRSRDDRLLLGVGGEYAEALTAPASYLRATALGTWTSSPSMERAGLSIRAGADWASRDTPLGNWPIAGGNVPWAITLRAHPLNGPTLTGLSAGRRILHGGIAADHPVHRAGPVVVAFGLFLDAAAVGQAADGHPRDRVYVDGGGGLRLGMPGQTGVLRVDLARGLAAEPRTALTIGIQREWHLFRPGR